MKTLTNVLLCNPLHFQVTYSINPWMRLGAVDPKNAMKQWKQLVSVYESLGITVQIIDQVPGLPDMVFATDQGIVRGNTILISNFRHRERQGERDLYLNWFKAHHFEPLFLSDEVFVEGNGESLFMNGNLFMGIGFRACPSVAAKVEKALGVSVTCLDLIDPYFYHLDTAFFPLNDTTAFYYPQAFSIASQNKLKQLIPTLIPFTKEEAQGFSANSVVSGKTVIAQSGNPTFITTLASLGYDTIEVDVSEFIKAGGGIHCLTNVLEEKKVLEPKRVDLHAGSRLYLEPHDTQKPQGLNNVSEQRATLLRQESI